MCKVGMLLYIRAKEEGLEKPSMRPKSFPFVAKMYERIFGHIDNIWVECVVHDRSISAAGRMIGTYRAKTQAVTGYEVETDDGVRHYLNSKQIKPLKPKVRKERQDIVSPTLGGEGEETVVLGAPIVLPSGLQIFVGGQK
jgi:hypothetical protein